MHACQHSWNMMTFTGASFCFLSGLNIRRCSDLNSQYPRSCPNLEMGSLQMWIVNMRSHYSKESPYCNLVEDNVKKWGRDTGYRLTTGIKGRVTQLPARDAKGSPCSLEAKVGWGKESTQSLWRNWDPDDHWSCCTASRGFCLHSPFHWWSFIMAAMGEESAYFPGITKATSAPLG